MKVRCWTRGGPNNEVWNWGDAVSPVLSQLVTGRRAELVDYTEYPDEPHLMICGSTLKWASATSVLWGVGEIAAGMSFVRRRSRPREVAAVRGPLTRQRLIAAGIPCPDVYGDPALLFPRYYHPPAQPEYELGVIPHYIDHDSPRLAALAADERVRLIDITQAHRKDEHKVFSFIDEVRRCRRIASSSLHGLILADAYGIPSLWVELSDNVFGRGFKFRDYFQSVCRQPADPVRLHETSLSPADLIRLIDRRPYRIRFDGDRLLAHFPG